METMTKDQMVQFLRGMNAKKQFLSDEKKRLKGSIESLNASVSAGILMYSIMSARSPV